MNLWLFVVIQSVCSVVIGFAAIVVVLTLGLVSGTAIIWCFVIGTVVSLPIAWAIYRRMNKE